MDFITTFFASMDRFFITLTGMEPTVSNYGKVSIDICVILFLLVAVASLVEVFLYRSLPPEDQEEVDREIYGKNKKK